MVSVWFSSANCYPAGPQLQIPATLMLVALEEGPGPPIKFQYADLSKLYQTVALLVRCCDIGAKMTSSQPVSGRCWWRGGGGDTPETPWGREVGGDALAGPVMVTWGMTRGEVDSFGGDESLNGCRM